MHVDLTTILVALIYGAFQLAGTFVANRRAKHAISRINDVSAAVGPANGENVKQALERIAELTEYSHDRYHKLDSRLDAVSGLVRQLGQSLGAWDVPAPEDIPPPSV